MLSSNISANMQFDDFLPVTESSTKQLSVIFNLQKQYFVQPQVDGTVNNVDLNDDTFSFLGELL